METFKAFVKVLVPGAILAVSFSFCGGGGGGGGGSSSDSPNVLGGYVYFPADDGSGNGWELWRSNGIDTPNLAADINSGAGSSYPSCLTGLGGKVYFRADSPATGRELFVYDPVLDEADIAADINSGPGDSNPYPVDYGLNRFTVMEKKLFFTASNGSDGYELYILEPGSTPNQAGDMNTSGDFVYTD